MRSILKSDQLFRLTFYIFNYEYQVPTENGDNSLEEVNVIAIFALILSEERNTLDQTAVLLYSSCFEFDNNKKS